MSILVTSCTDLLSDRLAGKLGNARVFSGHDKGDVRDIVALSRAFPADIVYHLATRADNTAQSIEINIDGTENVVRLCRKYKVKQLVFMSSSGVLGNTLIPARETFGYAPRTPYERSMVECERIVAESGVPYTIIRLPVLLAADIKWQGIFRAAKRGHPIIGTGKNRLHLAHIDDVVDLLVHVKGNKNAMNQIFHIGTKDIMSYEEVYATICRELGSRVISEKVGVHAARAHATLHSFRSALTGRESGVAGMSSLAANMFVSTEKAQSVLGFRPRYDTKKAIRATVAEMKAKKMI